MLLCSRSGTGGGVRGAASLLGLFAAGILLVLATPPASAGETDSYRFEPHPLTIQGQERRVFSYELPTGTTVTDAVQITNKTDEVRRFRLYPADATEDSDGNVTVDEFEAPTDGVGSWIDIDQTEYSLLPRTSAVVPFTLSRPSGQAASGVGALVAEEIKEPSSGGGIEVVFRIAILVRVGGDPTGISVRDAELSLPLEFVPSTGAVETEVVNHTLGVVKADVTFTVESFTGREWQLEPTTVEVEPGGTAVAAREWTTVPRWGGVFRVRAEATWEAGTVASTSPRGLYPPLWLLALAIVAVGIRGLRELWDRRKERNRQRPVRPAPDPAALRRRLIEAALWLHAAGRDAPAELRETTVTEARNIGASARETGDADLAGAARSLEIFAYSLGGSEAEARQAAVEFDTWLGQQRDDPRVRELVGA